MKNAAIFTIILDDQIKIN